MRSRSRYSFANEEMCSCYGSTIGKTCGTCISWQKGYCKRTNGKLKCPSWGSACSRYSQKKDEFLRNIS